MDFKLKVFLKMYNFPPKLFRIKDIKI